MPSVKVIKRETRHMPAFGHACPASPYQWEFEDSLVVGLALVAGMDYPEAHAIAEQALDRLSVREGEGAKAYASRRMADFHARRDAGLPPRWAKVNRVLGFSRVTDGPPPGDYTEADIQPRAFAGHTVTPLLVERRGAEWATLRTFTKDHPAGRHLVFTPGGYVAVIDGVVVPCGQGESHWHARRPRHLRGTTEVLSAWSFTTP
jgi:hypothetical protein